MRFHFFVIIVLCFSSCQHFDSKKKQMSSEEIAAYIDQGYKIYGTKTDPLCFAKSMAYFDTALDLAIQNNDTIQMGRAYFGKGSVYDAWNKDKDKTIEYFTQSIQTIEPLKHHPQSIVKKLYTMHILAHAYEKKGDSSMAIHIIYQTLNEANQIHDTLQNKLEFMPQLALIATVVDNYHLADSILKHCCQKIVIANSSYSYHYLDNFYLTKAKIDINYLGKKTSAFLDSFYLAYTHAKTPVDSLEMLEQIFPLYLKTGNKEMGYKSMKDFLTLDKKLNSISNLLEAQQNLNLIENKLRASENDSLKKTRWIYVISILALFLAIGGSGFAYHKQALEKEKLANSLRINERLRLDLEQQNQMNLLLNKEIHHRIKNNLQFIHSIIDMQIDHSQSQDVKKELEDTQFRIRSVSNSYDMMRKEIEINLRDGINQFLNVILQNFKNHKSIQWISNIDHIQLDSKYTIPIFVILNELITNTIKHSDVNDPATAYIDISLIDGKLKINYRDTNIIQSTIKMETGLGIEIIELLVQQLKGTMTRSPNFEYTFDLPYITKHL